MKTDPYLMQQETRSSEVSRLADIRQQVCSIFPLTHAVLCLCDNSGKEKASAEF